MAVLTNNEINEIRNSVDIVDVIGEYIPLTQKGKNFFGVCPFHDDHSPSMSVSRDKQIYKCFSCGASGNVFTFLMEYEHIDFKEALIELAKKSGITISQDIVKNNNKNIYDNLFEIYKLSTKFYQNNINTNSGIKAKEYLKKRNIDDDIIKEFQIGLSLDKKDTLTKLLLSKNFNEKELINSGISNKTDYGFQDVFTNRIVFPLWDISGKVIGYSGRIYLPSDNNVSKYINTRETPIFKKGMNLYNYHRAKEEVRISKCLIIMEGFMDVIRSYSVGIKNVIASMGTSLTNDQLKLIKKLSTNVILCFDGDNAGSIATLNCGNDLMKIGIEPSVIKLKEDLDPDEYIEKYGKDKFEIEIEAAIPFIDFKLSYYRNNKNFQNSDDVAKYINQVLIEVNNINDEIKRELILKKISEEFSISLDTLNNKLNKYLSNQKPIIKKETVKKDIYSSKYQKAEKRLIYYMLKSSEIIKMYEINVSFLPTPSYRVLASEIIYYFNKYGNINIADFITYLDNKQELIKLLGEIEMEDIKEEYSIDEINDYIKVLKEYNLKSEISRLKDLMSKENDINKKIEYAESIMKLKTEE